MKDPRKAKWLLGASGVMLSAVLLTQMNNATQAETTNTNDFQITGEQKESMTKKEKELVQLDWTNFEIEVVNQISVKSERKTRRT